MSTVITTAEHKTALGKILAAIGGFVVSLFHNAGKSWGDLTPSQQQGAINGSQVSEIIKNLYASGETAVVSKITEVTGLPADVAEQTVLSIAKDAGVNTTSVQAYLDHIADTVQKGVTDNKWNSLWQGVAMFGANYLTQGKLDWVTLSLGIIEYAFKTFVAGKLGA